MTESPEILAAREKLKAKFGSVRTGGRGTVRRKKRVTKASTNEDKKVQATLKRIGVQPIPGIEEVNMFMDDNQTVLNIKNPKVQAAVQANTFVITGPSEKKKVSEMMPGIFPQLDQQKLFSDLAQNFKLDQKKKNAEKAAGEDTEKTDDEVPDTVEDFEEVSEQ